jgi:hypothetical protein
MNVDDFFDRLIDAFQRAEVPYMLTGSYASAAYGTPRATNDIDVVIAPTEDQLRKLLREFPDDRYYADEIDALESMAFGSQFNVIDFATSWKADLIFRKNRPFSRTEFDRRRLHSIAGRNVFLVSPEDILVAKLEWAKFRESDRQIEDAAGVIRRQGAALDRSYVEHWVGELELELQWAKALAKAG